MTVFPWEKEEYVKKIYFDDPTKKILSNNKKNAIISNLSYYDNPLKNQLANAQKYWDSVNKNKEKTPQFQFLSQSNPLSKKKNSFSPEILKVGYQSPTPSIDSLKKQWEKMPSQIKKMYKNDFNKFAIQSTLFVG
jgi:hypothetical protein